MPYAPLFPGIDNNKQPKKKPPRTRRNKSHRRRQSWEECYEPQFYHETLFYCEDFADALPVPDEIPFDELTPDEQQLCLERRKNVAVYELRHANQRSLYHPPALTRPIDYVDCLMRLAEEMRLVELASKGKLRFASGVFLADKTRPEKGYRVQVWDNIAEKKQHVCYRRTRDEAEKALREYWKKKGVDTHVELPAYFKELLQEAIDSRKVESQGLD